MKYPHYSTQFKEAILKKLSQSDLSVSQFSRQEGINFSTLYSWQKQFKTTGFSVSKEIRYWEPEGAVKLNPEQNKVAA